MASPAKKDDRNYSLSNSVSPTPPKSSRTRKSTRNSVFPFSPNVSLDALSITTVSSHSEANKRKRKHSRWFHLKRRLLRRGVVPVNNSHPHFQLLSCIREGIRKLNDSNPMLLTKSVLTNSDFEDVKKIKANFDGQDFEFESYSSSAFAAIRMGIGIEEQEFLNSIAPINLPYFEFISNSKSGQDFFLSHDMQYMFKSNRKRDVMFFLSVLSDYMQHFIAYPHSLLVKYIGCFAIKLKGKRKKYFLVMQSIFYPSERIEERYDIKGCTAGRHQNPNEEGSTIITVLKDQNFLNEMLDFGDQGDWFIEQIKADSQFLCGLNCMDYSLLIGRQMKHLDEKGVEPVSTIVERIGKSISPTKKIKSMKEDSVDPPAQGTSDVNYAVSYHASSPETVSEIHSDNKTLSLPQYRTGIMFPRSLADGVENFHKEHRRLLPNCKNGLHIMDGKEYRYYVGVVDFLTRFDWRQKTAQFWKIVKYKCGDHSTKNPKFYSQRFVNFLSNHVL
ncbi:unnamed protein product [Lymnaea stagnalis]|uniref:PIPK domain-containing protein n=1 Tax=Lymnaea stagnalis TaxID=6523 RepID=A0AAV2IFE7_LYMST